MELGGGFALNLNIPETQPQDVQGPSMVRYSATCVYFFLAKEKQVEKLKSVPVGIIYHIYPRVNKYLDMPYSTILQTTLAEKTTSSSTSQPFPDLNWSSATEKQQKTPSINLVNISILIAGQGSLEECLECCSEKGLRWVVELIISCFWRTTNDSSTSILFWKR